MGRKYIQIQLDVIEYYDKTLGGETEKGGGEEG